MEKSAGGFPLPCACANLRRAARIVTQRYDDELRPVGIRATQFTLLQALDQAKKISQGRLGELLGIDSTTLTRTLLLLRRRGWIQPQEGNDRRQVCLTLTPKGERAYRHARPYWSSAQKKLRRDLGRADWKWIMESTVRTAALARTN